MTPFITSNRTIKVLLYLLFVVLGCNSLKQVDFKTPVDTTTKEILSQKKQIFSIDELEVYASNKFDAARLNSFKKVNDSTVKAIIKPENTPINNSGYYAFKIGSIKAKTIYVEFSYPEGFKHRYTPKIKKNHGHWQSLDTTNILKNGKEVPIKLNVSKDTLLVSAQEIVTSKDTENWYRSIIANKLFVHLKTVGKSKLGRNLPVLDIYRGTKNKKPIVALLTRQHPPEVTGVFA